MQIGTMISWRTSSSADKIRIMHPITVREARMADLDSLERFQQGVVSAERPYDPTLRDGTVCYYDIAHMLSREDVLFLVAESEARVVGCGFAQIEEAEPFFKHQVQAYFGLMYVEPAYRGRGVNAEIIRSLKRWCRSKNVWETRLDVYEGNTTAVKAYEKAGFSKLSIEMRMPLCDE
jgi:GNAT superfamily N-acetyltransferase